MRTCFSLFLFGPLVAVGQTWGPAEVPVFPFNIQQVYSTEARDVVYYAGVLRLNANDWPATNPIIRYEDGEWAMLGAIGGQVMSVVIYNDTLIAGGLFNQASGTPCAGIAFYDGEAWQPYGDLEQSVRRLRVLDGELYAVGSFDTADGAPAPRIAKRVGNSWVPVGSIMDQSWSFLDVIKYNGELIAIGGVDLDGGSGIARYDGNEWHLLGPGILGGGGQCLQIYNGDLYVGGQIPAGNAGQNIMRWDGEQFHGLGTGIQWQIGNLSSIATVFRMEVHDGLLFVGGGFRGAGGVPADGLATWNGEEWCAVPGDFTTTNGIKSMAFYHDTLFVACGWTLDGDSMNMAAKFIGEEYTGLCNSTLSIPTTVTDHSFGMFPNPSTGTVQLKMDTYSEQATLKLYDALGRKVLHEFVKGTTHQLDLSDRPKGFYLVTLQTDQGVSTRRLVLE